MSTLHLKEQHELTLFRNRGTVILKRQISKPLLYKHTCLLYTSRHTRMVLREKVRMLLDEGNDVINFLLLCVETTFSLLCHNKFVTTDTSAVAVQTVSYTHLDVYKRQIISSSIRWSI